MTPATGGSTINKTVVTSRSLLGSSPIATIKPTANAAQAPRL